MDTRGRARAKAEDAVCGLAKDTPYGHGSLWLDTQSEIKIMVLKEHLAPNLPFKGLSERIYTTWRALY